MEVGCPGTWGWSCRPQTWAARTPQKPALPATQLRVPPAIPSPSPGTCHRNMSSVEIIITEITNDNNNNKVIVITGRREWEKTLIETLQKLIKTP